MSLNHKEQLVLMCLLGFVYPVLFFSTDYLRRFLDYVFDRFKKDKYDLKYERIKITIGIMIMLTLCSGALFVALSITK